jgi:ComEC/Rec2-related protein
MNLSAAGRHSLSSLVREIRYRPLVLLAGSMLLGLQAVTGNRWWALPAGAGLLLALLFARCRPVIWLLIGFMGLGWLRAQREAGREISLASFTGRAVILTGAVARPPRPVPEGQGFPLQVKSLRASGKILPAQGRVWITAPASCPLAYLDSLEITGNLCAPGRQGRASILQLWVGDSRLLRKLGKSEEPPIAVAARRARHRALERLAAMLPETYRELNAQLLGSLFFGGEESGLPRETLDLFRRTGTLHILVVSGTQISLFFSLIYFPGQAGRWRRQRELRRQLDRFAGKSELPAKRGFLPTFLPSPGVVLLGLGLMSLYALLTQGGESVARAAVMAGLVGGALLLRSLPKIADHHPLEADGYSLLAAAALLLLIIQPQAASDISFQLSFLAVAGLVFLSPRLRERLYFLNDFWGYLISATVSAQLATLPLIAWHFGRVSLIGFLSNLAVVPVAGVLLWLGLAGLALSGIWWGLAWPLGWLCSKLCWLMTRLLAGFAALPGGNWSVGELSWVTLASYYILLLSAGWALGIKRRKTETWETLA